METMMICNKTEHCEENSKGGPSSYGEANCVPNAPLTKSSKGEETASKASIAGTAARSKQKRGRGNDKPPPSAPIDIPGRSKPSPRPSSGGPLGPLHNTSAPIDIPGARPPPPAKHPVDQAIEDRCAKTNMLSICFQNSVVSLELRV